MYTIIRKFPGFLLLFWLVAAHPFTGAGKAHASWEAEWERTVEAAKKEVQRIHLHFRHVLVPNYRV